jgi:hypothetical protein
MKTVIANDRVGRFAELDHAVVEEVQVIMETSDNSGSETANGTARIAWARDWLCAALQATVRSRHFS